MIRLVHVLLSVLLVGCVSGGSSDPGPGPDVDPVVTPGDDQTETSSVDIKASWVYDCDNCGIIEFVISKAETEDMVGAVEVDAVDSTERTCVFNSEVAGVEEDGLYFFTVVAVDTNSQTYPSAPVFFSLL